MRNTSDVTSIRIPAGEAREMDALAARIGTSRSKLLRAGFVAIAREDPEAINAALARLTPDRRDTWRPRRSAEEAAA